MQFSDLPNGGHNLRLYTYDPEGSPNGPATGQCGIQSTNTWIYNTGHFDISLGVPCSQPDPQGFCDPGSMNQYAASRGEMLVMVSRSDLSALCAYRAPVQAVTAPRPVQTIVGATSGGVIQSGGVTGATIITGGSTPGSTMTVPGYVPPPGTPIDQGGLPSGVGSPTTPVLSGLYRFILYNPSSSDPNKPYSTGANYPGCSQVNTMNCQGMNFPSEYAAIQYAESHGEIPYRVLSAGEVWGVMNGSIPIDPSRLLGQSAQGGMGIGTLALVGLGLWFLSGR